MSRSDDKKALLIEDDPHFRGLVRDQLEEMGFQVSEAGEGRAALHHLTTSVPDFVVTDLVLPEISGYELCEHVRGLATLRHVPLLVMSGRSLPQDRAAAEEAGADAFLAKPFTREQLAAEVRRLIFRAAEAQVNDPRQGSPPDESLVDWALLRDGLGFARRAVGRHRALFYGVVAAMVAAAAVALFILPKSYHVEAKILAQRNQLMPALNNPNRAVPREADAPTRAAAETMLSRDNLIALIKQTDLLDRWDASRSPAVRWKDALFAAVQKPPTDEDRLEALLGLLEKRLKVEADDASVSVSIDWPEAQLAFRLVEASEQSFIESRHVAEVSIIAEAISILESHSAEVKKQIDAALAELERGRPKPAAAGPRRRPAPAAASDAPDEEAARIAVQLAAKKRALSELEEFRGRRLSELQAQLAEARATFADSHPTVLALRGSLEALGRPSPQIASLRREVEQLEAEHRRHGGSEPPRTAALTEHTRAQAEVAARPMDAERVQADPALEVQRERLASLLRKHDSLQERIDAAQIELDTARAAFKYRYTVVKPAIPPKKAARPSAGLFFFGGLLGGLVLALVACVWADLRGGRVVEAWQAERLLGLHLVGEVRAP